MSPEEAVGEKVDKTCTADEVIIPVMESVDGKYDGVIVCQDKATGEK
jgi:hypothetical protein